MNVNNATQVFCSVEKKLDIFYQKIDGVYFWDLVRWEIHYLVLKKLGIYQEGHSSFHIHTQLDRKMCRYAVDALVRRNPFLKTSHEILFIGHPRRKKMENGRWQDVYVDPLLDSPLISSRSLALEPQDLFPHMVPAQNPDLQYLDIIQAAGLVLRKTALARISLSEKEKRLLSHINKQFSLWLDIEPDGIETIILRSLLYRKTTLPVYQMLFRKLSPKILLLVVGYLRRTITEAARSIGIPVAELQHGTLGRNHLGYSFPPEYNAKERFPDYLLLFGDFWKNKGEYPIKEDCIYCAGFPYFNQEYAKYKNLAQKNQILFISQGTIGKELSRFAVALAHKLYPQYSILYKLHPGEYTRWKTEYPWLADAEIEVVSDDFIPLYQMFAESAAQVGVYSTAVYEGLGFGLKTFLVALPGVEFMEELTETNEVCLISHPDEMVSALLHPSKKSACQNAFFAPCAQEKVLQAIEDIIISHPS